MSRRFFSCPSSEQLTSLGTRLRATVLPSRKYILCAAPIREQSSAANHNKRYILNNSSLSTKTRLFDEYGQGMFQRDSTPVTRYTSLRKRGRGHANGRGKGRSTRSLTKSFLPPINPSPGDWLCPKCECVNYRSRPHCINCGIFVQDEFPRWCNEDGTPWTLPPPFEPFPGDWKCVVCKIWNYKDQFRCLRCHASVSDNCEYLPLPVPAPHQFICAECNTLNYAHRSSCIKCDADRPLSAGPAKSPRRKEWRCVNCNLENLLSNECCSSCGHENAGECEIELSCSQQVCQGDWLCCECSQCNISESQCCSKCQLPTRSSDRVVSAGEAFTALPGDWICSKCNVANYRFDTFCFLCGSSRTADAMEIQYDSDRVKMKSQAVPFDWECSVCHRYVFAFNERCPTCPTSVRTKNSLLPAKDWEDAHLGDWRCDKCGTTTSFSRKRCFHCGEHKSHHSQSLTVAVTGGNFICRTCEHLNLNFRPECVNCGSIRGSGRLSKLPSQRFCKDCNVFNFSWRICCFYCHGAL